MKILIKIAFNNDVERLDFSFFFLPSKHNYKRVLIITSAVILIIFTYDFLYVSIKYNYKETKH